ncbi:DNA repair protein RecN [Oleiagrimonas sp.]|jgi:DNA repair protein RecN (Recombination protein N)|uniref:DNA repair protein RecN n=1 Tax=Oleiagrimonas sp. TaxID=2010330 RepID=UPI0026371AD6|nr:DNA repair protein RecN [Oleiagrimonas sp.]MDA3914462.1 DNA repair protein RecN [Oleiagrimonas sp.]
MLSSLYVRNFAVVEEAEIGFGPGMTVVTGETGAGKSLLVDALMLLSGTRADSGMVRAGCERAELSAEFDLAQRAEARAWLERQELDDEGHCRLRRVLKAEGSSRAWINGRPATLSQLSELAALLVEIHGQHEHQALLSRGHQLDLLDAFAQARTQRGNVDQLARTWRQLGKRIATLTGGEDRQDRIDLLRHELDDLQRWALPADDLAELESTHRRLANAGRLLEGANGLSELLDGDSEFAVRRALGRAQSELTRLAELDERLQPLAGMLENAEIQLSEALDGISHYASDLDMDPGRYAEIDAHLARLHELGRRHRLPMEQLQEKADELAASLQQLEGAGEALDCLHSERSACEKDYAKAAATLGSMRRKAAKVLGQQVTALMQELGMQDGRFEIQVQAQEDTEPDALGAERCEFLVSANPGQPPRALRKVASGGELARISLAIEVAALGLDGVGSMIFDEVDSGIGGAVAEVVGQKLRTLGGHCQTLCVTHLPQVAAQGHAHIRVSKLSDGESTHTRIEALDGEARSQELARMLGGIEITRETQAHARKMLQQAQG